MGFDCFFVLGNMLLKFRPCNMSLKVGHHVVPHLAMVVGDIFGTHALKPEWNVFSKQRQIVLAVRLSVSLALCPHPSNWVVFWVELGKENDNVSLRFKELLHTAPLVFEIIVLRQNNAHLICF